MVAIVWRVEDEAKRVLGQRRAFRDCIASLAQPPSDVDAAELIYGELVANTVRYADGDVEVRLEVDDSCQPVLEVRDYGPGLKQRPRRQLDDLYAESGRGLGIVLRLARELAVGEAEGGGTVVRATLPVTPRTAGPKGARPTSC
jgi:signal transduction histidine kinase